MDHIEKKKDRDGDRHHERRSPAAEEVIGEGAREIRKRADVRNDLQPHADEREAVSAECARDVCVLAARLAAQRRGDENRISDRRGQDRRRENEVSEDDARPGERPGIARDFEDAGADEYADDRGVRLDSAKIAAETARFAFSSLNPPILSDQTCCRRVK